MSNGADSINVVKSEDVIYDKLSTIFKGSCSKILLVHPLPFNTENFEIHQARNKRYYTWPPYGIGVLCRNLRKRGSDVKLVDFNFEILELIENHPDIDNDESARDLVKDFWKERLVKIIDEFEPDLIGMTCMFTMGHEMLVRTADFVREKYSIPIVVGGVHITNAPDFVLNESNSIDFASLYESDVSFCDMVDIINGKEDKSKLCQIATLVGGEYFAIPSRTVPSPVDLDIVPDYDTLQIEKYSYLGEVGSYKSWLPEFSKSSSVLTNRGCRARCSFCSVRNFNGTGVRARSVDSVINEIENLKKNYGISHIAWIDDDLFFNKKRTLELFNKIDERDLEITWCASNGIIASVAATHEDLIEAAERSGCRGMTFGLESGNDDILKEVHKPSRVRHYYKVGDIMRKYPQIFTRGFLIIGFPNETLAQMRETVTMAQDVGLDWYGIQLLSPLPSTEIYDIMVGLGLIDDVKLKKNSEKDGSKLFVVRHGEKQRAKEKAEKEKAHNFVNPFEKKDPTYVPSREELHEIWLLVDYWINYEPILSMEDPAKLQKKRCILEDICNRMTQNNPLANLFLGITETKLGNLEEGARRQQLAVEYLSYSAYWQERFKALGLDKLCPNVS